MHGCVGHYMKIARETLAACISSLPENCRFQVIGFGSNYETLFSDPLVQLTNDTKRTALNHAKNLEANLGGTEILDPLKHIAGS